MSRQNEVPTVDWRLRGSVIVSNGRIFISPNSTRRDVSLPAEQPSLTSPFHQHKERKLTVHYFNQPVWWNNSWGWIGFMPLSPSFLSEPFRSLCWKPKVGEVNTTTSTGQSENRYAVVNDEVMEWKSVEDKIVQACKSIRLAHKIPGEMPPCPSELGYPYALRSVQAVHSRAAISRDWFVLWMGFLSYLICMSQHPHHDRQRTGNDRTPAWYTCLQKAGMNHRWLEGLMNSVVCDFDDSVPRNGVILKLSEHESGHMSVNWFLQHNIPVWILFNAHEERWLKAHRYLYNLVPPQDIVNDALSEFFNEATPEVKAIIMVHYLSADFTAIGEQMDKMLRVRELSTETFQFCCRAIGDEDLSKLPSIAAPHGKDVLLTKLQNATAEREGQLRQTRSFLPYPWPQLLDKGDFQDAKLYKHWSDFFSRQDRLHAELRLCETEEERQRREARERQPSKKKAVVYRWKKVVTGGMVMYARIRINRRNQEDVLHSFFKKPAFTRRFNAFPTIPEWDLYEQFDGTDLKAPVLGSDDSDVSDSENEYVNPPMSSHSSTSHFPSSTFQFPTSSASLPQPMSSHSSTSQFPSSTLQFPTSSASLPHSDSPKSHHSAEEICVDERAQGHGSPNPEVIDKDAELEKADIVQYMATLFGYTPVLDGVVPRTQHMSWDAAIKSIGVLRPEELVVSCNDQSAIIRFVDQMMKGLVIDTDLDDLSKWNRIYVAGLYDLSKGFVRITQNMYVFHHTQSSSVDWCLAVKGATAALVVIRLIVASPQQTSLTLARKLAGLGIPFQTLLLMPEASSKPRLHFSTKSSDYVYLNPHDRHYDHRDFESYSLSVERLLARPFGRAAFLQGGLIGRIAGQILSFDVVAEGPSSEVRIHHEGQVYPSERPGYIYMDDSITDHEVAILIGTYYMETRQANQRKVVSWMPPPTAWYESWNKHEWSQWTEVDEELFSLVLSEIDKGMQPKTRSDWRSWIRAKRSVKKANVYAFLDKLTERSENFMADNAPDVLPTSTSS